MSASFLAAVEARAAAAVEGASSPAALPPLVLESLLVELEIEKYRQAFAAAGIGDAELEAARADGPKAVDALVAAVGLRGGSATKVRRRLLVNTLAEPSPRAETARQGKRRVQPEDSSAAAAQQREGVRRKDGLFVVASQLDLEWVVDAAKTSADDSSAVVVVEFSAAWCGGCQKFAPQFARLANELPAASMCTVDVDESVELAQAHAVSALPHFVIFRDGKKWDSLVGGKATILRQKVIYATEGRHHNASRTESKRKN
jgi:thioredoxin 1